MFNFNNQKEINAIEALLSIDNQELSSRSIDYDKEMKKFLIRSQTHHVSTLKKTIILKIPSSGSSSPQKPNLLINSPIPDIRCRTELRTKSLSKTIEKPIVPLIKQQKILATPIKTHRNKRYMSEYKPSEIPSLIRNMLTRGQKNENPVVQLKHSNKQLPKFFIRFKKNQKQIDQNNK